LTFLTFSYQNQLQMHVLTKIGHDNASIRNNVVDFVQVLVETQYLHHLVVAHKYYTTEIKNIIHQLGSNLVFQLPLYNILL